MAGASPEHLGARSRHIKIYSIFSLGGEKALLSKMKNVVKGNKMERALNFWFNFSNKSNIFFLKFNSGNGKVNVLRVTLAHRLYTNRFFSPVDF